MGWICYLDVWVKYISQTREMMRHFPPSARGFAAVLLVIKQYLPHTNIADRNILIYSWEISPSAARTSEQMSLVFVVMTLNVHKNLSEELSNETAGHFMMDFTSENKTCKYLQPLVTTHLISDPTDFETREPDVQKCCSLTHAGLSCQSRHSASLLQHQITN